MKKEINLIGTVGWEIDSEEFAGEMNTATGDIDFEMGSGGGYITDGVFMLNLIRKYNKGTTTARISYAASMMTQFAMACDKIEVYDNAIFMIHNAQNIVIGDHNDMREAADLQERMSDMLANAYVRKTGKTLEEIKSMMDADTYLFGEEIVNEGFADSVISTDEAKDKDEMVNKAKVKFENAQKAMKNEKLTLSDMKENFKNCSNGCNMGGTKAETIPSDNVKLVNSKIGANMKFDRENLDATEQTFNTLLESRSHLNANIADLNLKLQENAASLEAKNAELLEANAKLSGAVSIEDAKSQADAAKTEALNEAALVTSARVEEAFASGVANKETVLAMIAEKDDTKAHEIALNAKPKTNAMNNSGDTPRVSSIAAYANKNKGSIK